MDPAEYEQYIARLVKNLDYFKSATIETNKRFKGIRQPGEYEIDISVELWMSEALYYLLIIECKNWKRPVDRPVVQKLAQTRDAIAAQKGAIVSPIGFTSEAIEVAKVLGIALWVIAEKKWRIIMGLDGYDKRFRLFEKQRRKLIEIFAENREKHDNSTVVQFNYVQNSDSGRYFYPCRKGSAVNLNYHEGIDGRTALSEMINDIFLLTIGNNNEDFQSGISKSVYDWFISSKLLFENIGKSKREAETLVMAIGTNNLSEYFNIYK